MVHHGPPWSTMVHLGLLQWRVNLIASFLKCMKKIQYDRNTKSNGPKRLQKSWTTASTLSRLRNSISGFSQKSKLQNLLKVTLQRCSHCSCISGLFVTAAAGTSDVTNGLHTVWQTYRDTTVKSSPKAFASCHSCVRFELLYNIHEHLAQWCISLIQKPEQHLESLCGCRILAQAHSNWPR